MFLKVKTNTRTCVRIKIQLVFKTEHRNNPKCKNIYIYICSINILYLYTSSSKQKLSVDNIIIKIKREQMCYLKKQFIEFIYCWRVVGLNTPISLYCLVVGQVFAKLLLKFAIGNFCTIVNKSSIGPFVCLMEDIDQWNYIFFFFGLQI